MMQRIFAEYNRQHPEHPTALVTLLRLSEKRGEKEIQEFLVSEFFRVTEEHTESQWVEWSDELRTQGMVNAAAAVMTVFYDRMGTTFETAEAKDVFLGTRYMAGDYSTMVELSNRIHMLQFQSSAPWNTYLVTALGCGRARDFSGLWAVIETACGAMDMWREFVADKQLVMEFKGTSDLLHGLREELKNSPDFTISGDVLDRYDPYSDKFSAY